MSIVPILALLAAAADGGNATPAKCFHSDDASRGWKKVSLSALPKKLAAAANVPQVKLGSWVETTSEDAPEVFTFNGHQEIGKQRFEFTLHEGTNRLVLRFAEGLKGAKVDVIAKTQNGTTHPLWDEKRTRDSTLDLIWEVARVSQIEVVIHQHLREAANLTHWTTYRKLKVGEDHDLLAEFQEPESLYYFNDGSMDVLLCEQEFASGRFDDKLLANAKPVLVQLKPAGK